MEYGLSLLLDRLEFRSAQPGLALGRSRQLQTPFSRSGVPNHLDEVLFHAMSGSELSHPRSNRTLTNREYGQLLRHCAAFRKTLFAISQIPFSGLLSNRRRHIRNSV